MRLYDGCNGTQNGKICDDSDYICGEENEINDETYSMYDTLEKNSRYKKICISEPTNGAKYLVKGNVIVYLSENG